MGFPTSNFLKMQRNGRESTMERIKRIKRQTPTAQQTTLWTVNTVDKQGPDFREILRLPYNFTKFVVNMS